MIALARLIAEHEDAIEADLQQQTGRGIEDLGDALSWSSASSVIKHLDFNSALARELSDSDINTFGTQLKTNYILADIYDVINALYYAFVKVHGGKGKKPKPYPRPGDKKKNVQRYGKGAMEVDELKKWLFRNKTDN